ncbi:MAG: tRNA (guanosine(46)-N7)-methyltransferase TrmB [Campylobacterota bacterium]
MPHLVTRPFDPGVLEELFGGFVVKGGQDGCVWLYDSGSFLVEIKRRKDDFLLKADKITRPTQARQIKQKLAAVAAKLDLEVLHSNINATNSTPDSPFLKNPHFFENFQTKSPLAVEIGFGSGRHLLHQAKKHPQKQFIGIEVHTPSINQVLKQIKLQGVTNVFIVNYDARLLLELLCSNSVETVYLHFPVPWDKKPHRRVISASFVHECMRVCQKGGRLNLRTDSENYFAYSLQTFTAQNRCEYRVRKNLDIEISSKYEDRWKKMEKNIYDLDLYSLDHSEEKTATYDFSFNLNPADVDIESLLGQTYKYENFFIHFQRRYTNSQRTLLQVSFGKFDKPENRYISAGPRGVCYLYQKPVGTKTNFLAHQKIRELLQHGKRS